MCLQCTKTIQKRLFQIEVYNKRRRPSKAHFTEDDIPDASVTVASLGLLLFFLLYVSLGALFLPLLNGEVRFVNFHNYKNHILAGFLEWSLRQFYLSDSYRRFWSSGS